VIIFCLILPGMRTFEMQVVKKAKTEGKINCGNNSRFPVFRNWV
jgi:hypothetical protein